MEKRSFGKTDMQVSVLGLGSHELSSSTPEEVSQILNRALDAGLNVIDTAECYGWCEELIGGAAASRRSEYYLFTKCGHDSGLDDPDWSPRLLEKNIERSLQRLRTDYLDLVQLHSCAKAVLQRDEVIDVLQRARAAGKTRYIGYSGDRNDALYAVKLGVFDSLQISINIADQEAIDRVLRHATARGMGIIAKHPVANVVWKTGQPPADSHLRTYWRRLQVLNYDFLKKDLDESVSTALRFTLSVPGVHVAIVGTTNPDRWRQNAALLAAGPLSSSQYESIRARWRAATWWRQYLPGGRIGWHGWA